MNIQKEKKHTHITLNTPRGRDSTAKERIDIIVAVKLEDFSYAHLKRNRRLACELPPLKTTTTYKKTCTHTTC